VEEGGKVEMNMEAIHGVMTEEGEVECRWVGNEGQGEVGKIHFRVKCTEGDEKGDWEGISERAVEESGGWMGGTKGMDWGDEEEEDEGGSEREALVPSDACGIWVAPVKYQK